MTTPTPAPGWYPSPDGQPYERWWGGQDWGEQTRPMQAAVAFPAAAQPSRMVTSQPVPTSHTFHLLMTIFTCGLWGIVWLIMILINSVSKRKVVTRIR